MELRWAVKWGEVISYLLMLGNTCHTCCIHPLAWQDSARIHDLLPLMPQLIPVQATGHSGRSLQRALELAAVFLIGRWGWAIPPISSNGQQYLTGGCFEARGVSLTYRITCKFVVIEYLPTNSEPVDPGG